MGSAFFGLTSKAAPLLRKNLFKQIHEIVFHGKGGYDYNTIYNMPVWLRKFTFSEIENHFKEERQAYEDAKKGKNQTTLVDSSGKVNAPEFAKASKPYKGKTSYK